MKPHLIGIAGPSCAGKSELARWLASRLNAPVLNLDHYYVDMAELPLEERAKRNFDEPAALEHTLILEHARSLASGHAIRAPRYDFATHTRAHSEQVIAPERYVILEGLFALHWAEVRALMQTKLFVFAPDEVCFERRLARDVVERGRTPESVRWQFETTVRPMAHQHVLPAQAYADLVLVGTEPIDSLGARVLALVQTAG
ncbi:MAG: uridine kinase [Bryobacteraceae bacterium]|nr:uridine kinase [Bryobacteraceae bacterium]